MKDLLARYFEPAFTGLLAYWLLGPLEESARICLAVVIGWAYLMHARHVHLKSLYDITDRQLVETDARLHDAEANIERQLEETRTRLRDAERNIERLARVLDAAREN